MNGVRSAPKVCSVLSIKDKPLKAPCGRNVCRESKYKKKGSSWGKVLGSKLFLPGVGTLSPSVGQAVLRAKLLREASSLSVWRSDRPGEPTYLKVVALC